MTKLSDFEINKKVGNLLNVNWANLDSNYSPLSIWKDGNLCVFDPCNNWSDAGPIIVDNGISLECVVVNRHLKTWRATFKPAYIKSSCTDTNPLRAAMIVFLEMQ